MAELTGFGYRPGDSFLHRMDGRIKMVCLILVSFSCLNAAPVFLWVPTALLLWMLWHIRMPLSSIAGEIRYFFLLLVAVFAAKLLSTSGRAVWSLAGVSITIEGVVQGSQVCWRLLLVVAVGLLLVATTRPGDIKAAIEWFLRPLPWIPEKRVATMVSLVVRFIPVIFNQSRETDAAQRSRCAEFRKNPATRFVLLATAITRRVFEQADKLAIAMSSRAYHENRAAGPLSSSLADWAALGVVLSLTLVSMAIP